MLNFLKKFILSLCVLVIIALLALYVKKDQLLNFLIQRGIQNIQNKELTLDVQSPTVKTPEIHAESLDIFYTKNLLSIPFACTQLRIAPSWYHLINENIPFTFDAICYEGKLSSSGTMSKSGILNAKVRLEELRLWKHPFFQSLGIKKGDISLEIKKLSVQNGKASNVQGQAHIKNVSSPRERTLPAFISPFPVQIPAYEIFSLTADFLLNKEVLDIENIDASSNLATVSGFVKNSSKSAELLLHLSEEGSSEFGSLLRSLAQTSENTNNFRIILGNGFRDFKILAIQ